MNQKLAAEWHLRAAKQGYSPAEEAIGEMYDSVRASRGITNKPCSGFVKRPGSAIWIGQKHVVELHPVPARTSEAGRSVDLGDVGGGRIRIRDVPSIGVLGKGVSAIGAGRPKAAILSIGHASSCKAHDDGTANIRTAQG